MARIVRRPSPSASAVAVPRFVTRLDVPVSFSHGHHLFIRLIDDYEEFFVILNEMPEKDPGEITDKSLEASRTDLQNVDSRVEIALAKLRTTKL